MKRILSAVLLILGLVSFAEAQTRLKNWTLSWTDNSNNEDGFKVYLIQGDGSYLLIGNTPPNTTTFVTGSMSGIEGQTVCFGVKAFITAGSVFSQPANGCGIIPITVPTPAVSNLTGSISASKVVTLNWSDGTDNETGTKIYRNGVEVGLVSSNTTTWSETSTAAAGTVLQYQVAPTNSAGTAPLSNTVTLTVPSTNIPPPPTTLIMTVLSSSSIRLNWTDNATTETGYRILRTVMKGSNATKTVQLAADAVTYTDTGLTKNTTYCYCVTCFNASGESDPALCACAKTPLK